MHQFLLLPEFTSPAELDVKTSPQRVILKNASFAWGLDLSTFDDKKKRKRDTSTSIEMTSPLREKKKTSTTVLRGVNMELADGELVIVCGPTGCGKSALLKGVLGEIRCTQGVCQRTKHVAVVNQEPWIMAGTLLCSCCHSLHLIPPKYSFACPRSIRYSLMDLSPNSPTDQISPKILPYLPLAS